MGRTVCEVVLAAPDWTARERAHRQWVRRLVEPHERRARAGETHPVWDFLFSDYTLRPGQLHCWHPGYGVVLGGDAAQKYLGRSGPAELLRPARVGDGVPGAVGAPRPGAAAARRCGTPTRAGQIDWEQPGCVHANMEP
jgi:hypothetical protein